MTQIGEPVVRSVEVEAPPATVFEFFVDARKLRRWLAVDATLDARPGGVCAQLHEPADPRRGPFHMQGRFLEVDPPHRVVFTWGFAEPEVGVAPGSTVVEVTLAPLRDGAATRVRLVHRDLPAPAVGDHARGWTEMLDRLVRAVTLVEEEDV